MKTFCVSELKSGYGKKEVIKGISFDLKEGELCALLGLNGCGKSTLIKTLCALMPSFSGVCEFEGKDYRKLGEKKRAEIVAYIPQRCSSIYGKTVLDVVLMGFNAKTGIFENYSEKQKEESINALDRLGIKSFSDDLYEQLSEGQKQLVILARTIVQNTPLIFMDEPDSALDFTNKSLILSKISQITRTEGKTCLVSLHDPNSAFDFCDRILIMKDGKIIYDIKKTEYTDYGRIKNCLSDIYGQIRVIDNNGLPVIVREVLQ